MPRLLRTAAATAALALPLALSACGGSSGAARPYDLSDNGQTVTVSHAQRFQVSLSGPDWQFSLSPPFGPVAEVATRIASGRTTSVTATFVGNTKGSATISATHPGSKDHFVLHVTVTP
jgi:hypothetical protein